jgi:hypothetical protein
MYGLSPLGKRSWRPSVCVLEYLKASEDYEILLQS